MILNNTYMYSLVVLLAIWSAGCRRGCSWPSPDASAPMARPWAEGGEDTVGNPLRAKSSQFEFFELRFINSSFSSLASYWNQTNGSLSSNSRQQYLSQQHPPPSYLGTILAVGLTSCSRRDSQVVLFAVAPRKTGRRRRSMAVEENGERARMVGGQMLRIT